MTKPRTLIIGWDGATFDMLRPWMQAGELPNLAQLMAEGAHGPLPAWPNMNSAPAWTSIVTGYNAAQHGVFDFGDAPPQRGQRWHPKTGADRRRDPFWRLLSAAGQTVGIINVPISYPADPVNGFMLSGMDSPGINSPGFCHPPGTLDELRRAGIDYLLDVPKLRNLHKQDPYNMPQVVKQMVEGRSQAMLHLMGKYAWDLVMTVFVATDRMQHSYWPPETPVSLAREWQALLQLYRQLDRHLGEALAQVDEATTVIVLSDHGFGQSVGAGHCLNPLLARLGLLHFNRRKGSVRGRSLKYALRLGRHLVPDRWQPRLAQAFPKLHLQATNEGKFESIDWSRTQAFADGHTNRVSINLQGRQPEGIVPPGDYKVLCDRLSRILLDLTDPVSGRKVISQVAGRDALYHGPYLEEAADLAFEWDEATVGHGLQYHNEGDPIIIEDSPEHLSIWRGAHRSNGIFVARGPNIRRGFHLENASQYDVTPTLLYLQGQPIPDDMDGAVLSAMFTEDHLHRNPIRTVEGNAPAQVEAARELDEAEEEQITQRLRDLGYIE